MGCGRVAAGEQESRLEDCADWAGGHGAPPVWGRASGCGCVRCKPSILTCETGSWPSWLLWEANELTQTRVQSRRLLLEHRRCRPPERSRGRAPALQSPVPAHCPPVCAPVSTHAGHVFLRLYIYGIILNISYTSQVANTRPTG